MKMTISTTRVVKQERINCNIVNLFCFLNIFNILFTYMYMYYKELNVCVCMYLYKDMITPLLL